MMENVKVEMFALMIASMLVVGDSREVCGKVIYDSGTEVYIGHAVPGVDDIYIADSSQGMPTIVNLTAGGSVVQDIIVSGNSVLNINGGTVGSDVLVAHHGRVNLLAGRIVDEFESGGNSTCILSGGAIGDHLFARGDNRTLWKGGQIGGTLAAYDDSVITIEGSGFNYSYGAITDSAGILTGTLANGDPVDNLFAIGGNASIVLIPEPATVLLLGAGGLLFRGRRGLAGEKGSGLGGRPPASLSTRSF
ncbi:MAG TPA: PEP-CTERM sorting domain-containing protein [Anaerohalosphaeraceae bacterium]|jgi:hypothetical protein|nr:PEP-CTERM sorting domain-containing protein [Anaerohalosphaeraceae bacterium]